VWDALTLFADTRIKNHKNLTCEGRKKDFWSEYLKFRANHDLKNYGLTDEFTDLRDQTPGREVNL